MAKVVIDVKVVYSVNLEIDEMDDEMAEKFVRFKREKLSIDMMDKDALPVVDWITDNIHEVDCYDYNAEIEDLYVNDEPY